MTNFQNQQDGILTFYCKTDKVRDWMAHLVELTALVENEKGEIKTVVVRQVGTCKLVYIAAWASVENHRKKMSGGTNG